MLKTLAPKLGYHLELASVREWNVQAESEDEVMSEIHKILKAQKRSSVRARHFSFIDLKKRGLKWSPQWFGIVREPIERVIRKFHLLENRQH